jgi:signal transduction histidine kinase/CHASE3 domain sensor protein
MKYLKIVLSDLLFVWLGLLLLISFYFLYQQINRLSESERWVNNSNEVKLKLEQILSSVKDAETGQRGYLLSHDSIFLEPYAIATDQFQNEISELKSMLDDSQEQRNEVERIRELGVKRLDALNVLIYIDSRSKKIGEQEYLPLLVHGKQIMDSLRFEVTKMMVHQDEILRKRIDERNMDNIITPLYAFVFFVLTLGVLIFSFLRIKRQLREQMILKKEVDESKHFLDSVLDTTPSSIVVYEAITEADRVIDFKIIHANKNSEDLSVVYSRFKVGSTLLQAVPNAKKLGIYENFIDVLQSGKNLEFDFDYENNGVKRWYKVALNKLNNGISASMTDITDIVKTSEELATANRKLERKNRQLEQSNQELASFSYVASHDLQEPLRKIQGFSNRIIEVEAEKFSATAKDYFERIISAANRMQNLIDALLNFSRTNTQDQVFEVTDLNIILNEVKIALKENIDDKQASFVTDVLPTIPVIPVQIHQLFLNLIGNAIKYNKPGVPPIVKISVDVVKTALDNGAELDPAFSYWKISFEDNGIGFEQQYENKILELFQRLHGRTEYSGTGIGLAICKKIVQNHNGVIKAIGTPGVGAIFSIYFPVANR